MTSNMCKSTPSHRFFPNPRKIRIPQTGADASIGLSTGVVRSARSFARHSTPDTKPSSNERSPSLFMRAAARKSSSKSFPHEARRLGGPVVTRLFARCSRSHLPTLPPKSSLDRPRRAVRCPGRPTRLNSQEGPPRARDSYESGPPKRPSRRRLPR